MDRFPTPSGLTPRRDETQPPFPPKTDNLLERKWEGPNVKGGWGHLLSGSPSPSSAKRFDDL